MTVVNFGKQKELYGKYGDIVLDIYKKNKTKSKDDVIKLMKEKIISLLETDKYVSKHCTYIEKYNNKNVFDIGVNSVLINNGNDKSVIDRITREFTNLENDKNDVLFLDETDLSNKCWHLEIDQ